MAESAIKKIDYAISPDGQTTLLRFHLTDGTIATIPLTCDDLSDATLKIGQAHRSAWEQQQKRLGGADPRQFYAFKPMKVVNWETAVSNDGTPLVSLILASGARLDLGLDQNSTSEFLQWADRIRSAPPKGPRRDN